MREDKLLEIIELLPYSIRYSGEIEELLDYAKKQAERVQELEETVEYYKTVNKELHQRGRKVRKQNKRYKQALEFYAERDNYQWEVSYRPQQEIDCMVIDDSGHTARKALGVEQ